MSYRIAYASSDGKNIDIHFGEAEKFYVALVEDLSIVSTEERFYDASSADEVQEEKTAGCGKPGGCTCAGGGGNGSGGGCGGHGESSPKVKLLEDVRAVVCKRIGAGIKKQLEKKAVAAFDVDCSVEEALGKIIFYYSRIDSHTAFRGFSK